MAPESVYDLKECINWQALWTDHLIDERVVPVPSLRTIDLGGNFFPHFSTICLSFISSTPNCSHPLFMQECLSRVAPSVSSTLLNGGADVQIELEFTSVGFCGGRKTGEPGEPGEKPSEKGDNQQQTQPT